MPVRAEILSVEFPDVIKFLLGHVIHNSSSVRFKNIFEFFYEQK
jgi:hypothetical protein